jgi:NADH-quinone oxidoreductase subunit A
MASPTAIVAYLALFAGAGFVFLFVNLLIGHFLRPHAPNSEKLEVYECGEPTIGSSFVQFDLRFYVVALLFIIFDVEVAFFFPWATVYGKATHLMDPRLPKVAQQVDVMADPNQLTPDVAAVFKELGIASPTTPPLREELAKSLGPGATEAERNARAVEDLAQTIAKVSIVDIGVFFAVLLVGFAYVWKRGDLDWVRALSRERAMQQEPRPRIADEETVLSA